MTFRLLGPVAVLDPAGTPLPVGGPRRRALLAALLLHPGTSLPSSGSSACCGRTRPRQPPRRWCMEPWLRSRALDPGAPHVLVTRDGGYVLEVPPEWVDAARFERALEAGRRLLATSPQRASSLLTEALAEWRGPALAGVEEPFARAAAARWDELRLQCFELHADAELRLGRHATAVARLDELAVLRHDQRLQPAHTSGATLPAPLGSVIGRDGELDDLPALVRSHRLVTLTGPGGAGKTRLALEVARRLTDVDAHLVELAPLPTSALLAETLADALGIRAEPGHALARTVAAALSFRPAVVVLDNCEHLISACAEIVQILLAGAAELSRGSRSSPRGSISPS